MSRVEGIRLVAPAGMTIRQDERRPVTMFLPDVGQLTDVRAVDLRTIEFTFVATTTRGELLAERLRQGGAWIEWVPPKDPTPGVSYRGLTLRIVWQRRAGDALPGLVSGAR